MPTLLLPQAGKAASNATVLRWRKKPGDAVSKGDILLEIEIDEGFATVESPSHGMLGEISASAGKVVPVGAALATINSSVAQPASKRR